MYPRKPFIVAEMSCNHGGSLGKAYRIIEAAAKAGCDAIKLQTWRTMTMDKTLLPNGPWAGKLLVDLYEECRTPWEWHESLFRKAKDCGIECFSTPFDVESVDFLESLGVKRYKVASFEITDHHLIKYIADKGKPVILSTGASRREEVLAALNGPLRGARVTTLACSSKYPATAKDIFLRVYSASWGFSDHTLGVGCAAAACAKGADMIEKHLTLSRSDPTPDAGFSIEPDEMRQFVIACRDAAECVWPKTYMPDIESQQYRRSVYAVKDIKEGEELTFHNIRTLRPLAKDGIPANEYESLFGKKAVRDIPQGPLHVSDFK